MTDQAQHEQDLGDAVADRELEREHDIERGYSETWEDLDEWMIGDDLPDRVEDHDAAERMVRSVARRRRQVARAEELAKVEHARIDQWLARERDRFSTDYFEQCLETYHAALLEQDPKAKTIHLPSGDLTARAGQPTVEVDDEVFLDWAKTYGESLLRTKVEPDRAQIKATLNLDPERGVAVDQAGEMVPGIRVWPAVVSFKVKTGGES